MADDHEGKIIPAGSPFDKRNRGNRTMQEVRYPWVDFNPACETWGPGSFHPMSAMGLLGPKTYRVGTIVQRLDTYLVQVADERLTPKYREQVRHNLEIEVSHLAQLLNLPDAIPAQAGDEYCAWVQTLVEAQPEAKKTLWEREDLLFQWRKATGNWSAHRCPQCQRRGYENIGSSACCKSHFHHVGECCLHCGNDERDPRDRKETS